MRVCPVLTAWLVLSVPALACSQAFVLHGSAGPTLVDRGYSVAAGAGWCPGARVTLSVNVERTQLFTRVSSPDGRGGSSAFRGGTSTLGTAELRLALLARDRVTPYLLGGFAAGVSRPAVNATFPGRVTNDVRGFLGGVGLHVPLGPRLGLFADARLVIGAEANGEVMAVAPLRAGVNWRF